MNCGKQLEKLATKMRNIAKRQIKKYGKLGIILCDESERKVLTEKKKSYLNTTNNKLSI